MIQNLENNFKVKEVLKNWREMLKEYNYLNLKVTIELKR